MAELESLALEPIIVATDMKHWLARMRSHVPLFGPCLVSEKGNVVGNKENSVIII